MSTTPVPSNDVTDPLALRRAFGTFATGVTVLTVGGDTPHGMTANSFTTVSLDPPLILVCVGREAVMHAALLDSGCFGISVLTSEQRDIARYYADRRRPLGKEQFEFAEWRSGQHTGAPLLVGAAAHFECELWQTYDGGDHSIFIGHLLASHQLIHDDALLFLGGKFRQLERERSGVTT